MVGVLYTWNWDKERLADERRKKKEDLSLVPWSSPLVSPFPGFRIIKILWPLPEKLDRWGNLTVQDGPLQEVELGSHCAVVEKVGALDPADLDLSPRPGA